VTYQGPFPSTEEKELSYFHIFTPLSPLFSTIIFSEFFSKPRFYSPAQQDTFA
jgi:hypothetical protein